jgi:hypothetical protein
VRLIYLVTVDGLEALVLRSHAQRGGSTLQILVVPQVLLILILSAQLLLIEGAIPVSLGQFMALFVIGLVVGYLVKASFGEGLILDSGNLGDSTLLLHHANVLGVRVLVHLVLVLPRAIQS